MSNRMTYLTALALSLAATTAMAADIGSGNIEFQGIIKTEPCYVSSTAGDANTVSVNMGTVNTADVSTSSLASPHFSGSAVGSVNIAIHCTAEQTVNMQFKANASELNATKNILRVNGGSAQEGNAQNVGIAVYPPASTEAYNLATGTIFAGGQTVAAGGSVLLAIRAAYVKNGSADIVAGTANATLPFVLTSE